MSSLAISLEWNSGSAQSRNLSEILTLIPHTRIGIFREVQPSAQNRNLSRVSLHLAFAKKIN